jgi:hypothetical protein
MKHAVLISGFFLLSVGFGVLASTPPDAINYQGVLRNASDQPLDGSYGMVFRFFDDPTAGNELLVDTHAAVTVTGGLFNVEIGSGSVADGSGSGTFSTLADVFAQHTDLYLEVEVSGEALSPRTTVSAAGYALNARRVRGTEIVSGGALDLYVDGATGNDDDDGLTSATAKKTIMGAVRSIPVILNGDVTVWIKPGTYNEEVVLSGRQRNGLFTVVLQQDSGNPEADTPSVIIQPPSHPCETCADIGVLVTDELVRLVGLNIDGFDFPGEGADRVGDGIVASGSTNLTLANVVISNNDTGIFGTDGHFVELEADCVIEGNGIGLRASDHGSFEVNGPFDSCNNGSAALAARNSWIRFEGSPTDCVFCAGGDGAMSAELYSSITVDGGCSNWPGCTPTPEGLCPPP